MTEEQYNKLNERIQRINEINDFDLTWRWVGNHRIPLIEIYEAADRHVLAAASLDKIHEQLTEALPKWSLRETVVTKEGTNA